MVIDGGKYLQEGKEVVGLSVGAIVDKEASVGWGGPKTPNTVFAGYGTDNRTLAFVTYKTSLP